MDQKLTNLQYWRTVSVIFFSGLGLAVYDIGQCLIDLGISFSLRTFWWPVVICCSVVSITGMLFIWTTWFKQTTAWFSAFFEANRPKNTMISWGTFIILSLGFSTWVLFKGHIVLNGFFVRMFIYIVVATVGSVLIMPSKSIGSWQVGLACSLLIAAAIYRAMIYITGISSSPFSLGWSEGSRYYYGSLFFSERIYGQDLPLSVLHPSRYMLLAIPFIIPGLPIWVHRLWQVFLWIGLGWWTAVLLSRRLKIRNTIHFFSFSGWVFLFLNLGPVYYHLLFCVILIYWGVDFKKPVKTLLIVIASSVWAGLSRINWIPVPLFLVITLYFLERPWSVTNAKRRYLLQPVISGIGLFCAYFAYRGYISISGNEVNKFSSSFTSDLLWNRLWPNATFPLGILPGTILISIPLWVFLYLRLKNRYALWHPLKWLTFGIMLITLFLGGLVVSVKIGGGSNLHNMDAYFVLLMTVTGYVFWKREVYDRKPSENHEKEPELRWVTVLSLIIPIILTLHTGEVTTLPDLRSDQRVLDHLSRIVSETAEADGEVLFISERQLQVFNLIPEIPMVADYEKLELMEMVMAGNGESLERFNEDIRSQRFALIVNDSIQFKQKDESKAFYEEDDLWDIKVMSPLVKYYDYERLEERLNLTILTPKQK
jgi:hypothetical protein